MMRLGIIVASLVTLGSMPAKAEPSQYLCIPDQSTGLHYDTTAHVWTLKAFSPGEKYILQKSTDSDWGGEYKPLLAWKNGHPNWAFFQVGNKLPYAICTTSTDLIGNGDFHCDPIVTELDFDKDSGRFQVYYRGGYIAQPFWEKNPSNLRPKITDDVFIEVGRCEAI